MNQSYGAILVFKNAMSREDEYIAWWHVNMDHLDQWIGQPDGSSLNGNRDGIDGEVLSKKNG